MTYKSFEDLSLDIKKNIHKIPHDISLVVGKGRSGLLAANLISLFLNKPLAEYDKFLNGSILRSGSRGKRFDKEAFSKKILIVNDYESSIIKCRNDLTEITEKYELLFFNLYPLPGEEGLADGFFETIDNPIIFEWNIFAPAILRNACVDIDGVLCSDPSKSENDDGQNYINFLETGKAKFIPDTKIGTLVTSRLEKYRIHTERWLKNHEINYDELVMFNTNDKALGSKFGHANFKASEYKKRENSFLFIESSKQQSEKIFELTGKDVFCIDTLEMVSRNKFIVPSYKERMKKRLFRMGNNIKK